MVDIDKLNVETLETINKATLNSKIEQVNQYIGNKHDSTAYIKFEVNSFKLDTRSLDTRQHYAISLENQKTGAGVGNKFTLKIAFNANFSQYNSATELEAAMSLLPEALLNVSDVDKIREITASGQNRCTLQYGYLNNQSLSSPVYTGILLKYTVTANKQIIEYTLTGVAGEEANLTTVNWYPHIKGLELSGDTKVAKLISEAESANSSDDVKSAAYEELIKEFNNVWTGPVVLDPFEALSYFITDYNYNIKKISNNATMFRLCVRSNAKDALGRLKAVTVSQCRNQTPISYIEYLISMFTENNADKYSLEYYKEQLGITNRWIHEFRYDKTNNEIKVIIDRISSDENTRYDYELKGYTPDNNLLIDYSLQYDGSVALAVANGTSASTKDNAIYIDANGQLQAKASITNDMFVAGEIDEVLVKSQNTWVDKIACANNCSMTTFGLPFEIPVGAIFKIVLYLGNKPHHTSGRCFVTGVTDRISDSSMTTQFSMVRLPGKGGINS